MLDPSLVVILNPSDQGIDGNVIKDAVQIVSLSKDLHKQLLKLKGDFLQEGDGTVAYSAMRESSGFKEFRKNCSKLNNVDLSQLKEEMDKKAFFINVYNALTIHALAESVTNQKTVLQLAKFWQMYAYRIGSHDRHISFSLDDIEHGVLRCNQLHPTYKDYFFKEGDLRREFVMEQLDPRIHFALNCGAKSCPPIRLFSSENLDAGLDLAAKSFCQNDVSVDVNQKVVIVSKILDWYGCDFGPNQRAIAEKIMIYCKQEVQADFEKIRDDFKFSFGEYDWSIH